MIQTIGDVHLHARKLRELLLPHEAKPRSPADESPVPVDVESLIAAQAVFSTGKLKVRRAQLREVRENKRCNDNALAVYNEILYWAALGWLCAP